MKINTQNIEIDIRSKYSLYIKIGEWKNTKEQRDFILNYEL